VYANDGTNNSIIQWSNSVTILNTIPSVSSLILNTTNTSNNNTNQNLTAYVTTSDLDADAVKSIYNWYVNGISLPVLNMPFEGGSNSTWTKDYSPYGNNGTVTSATWNSTGGYDGKGAYMFDGIDDKIAIPTSTTLNLNNYTYMARVVRQNTGAVIMQKNTAAETGTVTQMYIINGVNNVYCYNGVSPYPASTTTLTADVPYHIACNYDGTNLSIYINGIMESSKACANCQINTTASWLIGQGVSSSYKLNGSIDEVQIYNRSLSSAEILALYQNKTDIVVSNELTAGDIWKTCVTPNDGTVDGAENCSNNITITSSSGWTLPLQTNNNGTESTNLSAYNSTTIQSVFNYTWHNNNIGKIKWLTPLNLSNGNIGGDNDLNNDLILDYRGVSINSSAARGLNQSANITFENVSCGGCTANAVITSEEFYSTLTEMQADGQSCVLTGKCSYFQTVGSGGNCSCTFSVSSFTGYTYGGNANLTINDSAEGISIPPNTPLTYYAYYVNATGGTFIAEASCNASDIDGTYVMSENTNFYNYTKSSGFVASGIKNWNVTCAKIGFSTLFANDTIVVNTPPSLSLLLVPPNGNFTINRTPTFVWNNSVDADGDQVTYNFILDDNPAFNNPEINVTGIINTTGTNTTYTAETELTVDTIYYWKVRGNDSIGYGDYSSAFNFTLQSYLAVSVLRNTVNFGTVNNSQQINTSTGNPLPFWAENVGNIISNVTITATPYFTSVPYPSTNYQFRIEANESGAFNTTTSVMSWTNMSNVSAVPHVLDLDWHSWKNDFLTGLSVFIPADEGAGVKNSTITFTIG
jgi:hypothetical protein